MSKTRLSGLLVNSQANAGAALYDDGYIRIYGGEQPHDTGIAISDQPLLVEGRFGTPAWGDAANGELTANPILCGLVLDDGDATWVRYFAADGSTVLHDDDVGALGSGAGLELDTTTLAVGAAFEITSLYHRVPRQ
jgi:hypothetical protein